ncbi:hypothetical protein Kpol_1014p25 [Vanderwaltozyma polyspora DSM 70294]|uniref:tRNA wybutosine-synthesizing protein 4 n=1 Tax=Vanderwaltozyma polyspora (strain ATCC 22028 / DSM 70294 / BCRC 21397 / CBS 2163 / NBRC 10782 / NRRL Y-8283 / UCD 57-17) TaxID=436907 RepID=A7TNF3_VANPO|nr:uncharacterized protein Kpol_1014p25 [Vanderwaltozyma polyspora DSM 70294]EDO16206.1 hypothetical protein Kpol_1014p25 [Vanderwaltozyma polyspora DSM 70294]
MNRDQDSSKPNRQYFKYFVPKAPKRSPCINRGYWLRLHAIRSRLECLLENSDKKVLVVNLGCGFDPLPFQILDTENLDSKKFEGRFSFLDVDYSDLIVNKVRMIREQPDLINILGSETESIGSTKSKDHFKTSKYEAVSCNLNDSESFEKLIKGYQSNDDDTIMLFIAEVSLAYMKPECADKIISICSSLFNSHFIIMEQLVPEGLYEPFSKQMLQHFKKNDSPLQSVLKYHTIQSQIDRFKELGFVNVNAGDLLQLWDQVDVKLRGQIEAIEPFDELEEFHLFCHHYVLCHATNDKEFKFGENFKFSMNSELSNIEKSDKFKIIDLNNDIKRKFGASEALESSILYFGGANPTRINETIEIDTTTITQEKIDTTDTPIGRMCHTLSRISESEIISIGGRKAPGQGFDECWKLDLSTKQWSKGAQLNAKRYRHSAFMVDDENVLICGGDTTDDPFVLYNTKSNTFHKCEVNGYDINESLVAAAISYNIKTQTGVIIGGACHKYSKVSDEAMVFSYSDGSITITNRFKDVVFQRYGGKSQFIDDNEVLVVGGTSPNKLYGQSDTIVAIDITTGDIRSIEIPSNIWQESDLCFVGFELQKTNNGRSILIVGGGATCYGFGSISNTILRIDY